MLGKMSWFCADKSGLLFYRAASDTRKDELFCADDYGEKNFFVWFTEQLFILEKISWFCCHWIWTVCTEQRLMLPVMSLVLYRCIGLWTYFFRATFDAQKDELVPYRWLWTFLFFFTEQCLMFKKRSLVLYRWIWTICTEQLLTLKKMSLVLYPKKTGRWYPWSPVFGRTRRLYKANGL